MPRLSHWPRLGDDPFLFQFAPAVMPLWITVEVIIHIFLWQNLLLAVEMAR